VSLLDALRAYDPQVRLAIARPASRTLERAVDKISRLAEGVSASAVTPPQHIIDATIDALRQNHPLSTRQAKLMCIAGLDQLEAQSDGRLLIERLLSFITENVTTGILKGLLIGLLRQPSENHGLFLDSARRIVDRHQERLPKIWQSRLRTYKLTEPGSAKYLAQMILNDSDRTSEQILNDAGLKGILSQAGYARSVFKAVADSLSTEHSSKHLQRFWNYIKTQNGVLFETALPEYSRALLTPYQTVNPNPDVQREILDFLIKRFGDPRIKADGWSRSAEANTAVVRRWLTEQSFDILLQVVRETNDTQMWNDRYAFWRPYIDQGFVTEAWVALGSDAKRVASGMVRQQLIPSTQSYGVITRGQIQSHHSMIIIRIGDFLMTEWTHDGKFRIYGPQSQRAPAMYKQAYDADRLRDWSLPLEGKAHLGNWQLAFAELIERYTGINPHRVKRARTTTRVGENVTASKVCEGCRRSFPAANLNARGQCPSCAGTVGRRR